MPLEKQKNILFDSEVTVKTIKAPLVTILIRVAFVVIRHHNQRNLEKRKFIHPYISIALFITVGIQGRNSKRAEA